LAGFNAGTIIDSLWDTVTSTQANAASTLSTGILINVAGQTTAQMMTQSTFTGWNIANTGGSSAIWRIYEGQTTPWLRSFLTPLSVTADNSTISYNGLNNALSTVNYTNTLTNTAITPNANLLGSVSMSGTAGKDTGSYTFTPTGLYSNQQGYDVSLVNGILTINPLALNLAASRTYDGTVNFDTTTFGTAGTINTGIGAETLVIDGIYGTVGSANAGAAQSLTRGSLILTDGTGLASNYSFGTLTGTINKAPLLITALAANKSYDGLAYSGGNGVIYSPFVNGETSSVLGGALSYGGTSQGAMNAGNYAITPSGLISNNYDISYVDSTLTIDKANAKVIANNASKTQGQTLNFTGSEFISSGLVNGETIGSVSLASLGAAATASVAGSPYAITASNATGGSFNLNNYNLSYEDGKLTVNPVVVPPVIPVIKPPVITVIKPPIIPTAPIVIDDKATVQAIKPLVIQVKVNAIDSEFWLSQLTPLQISTTFLHNYQQKLNDIEEVDTDFGQYKRDNYLLNTFGYEQRREFGKRKWSEKQSKLFNNRYTNALISIVNGGMKLPKLIARN